MLEAGILTVGADLRRGDADRRRAHAAARPAAATGRRAVSDGDPCRPAAAGRGGSAAPALAARRCCCARGAFWTGAVIVLFWVLRHLRPGAGAADPYADDLLHTLAAALGRALVRHRPARPRHLLARHRRRARHPHRSHRSRRCWRRCRRHRARAADRLRSAAWSTTWSGALIEVAAGAAADHRGAAGAGGARPVVRDRHRGDRADLHAADRAHGARRRADRARRSTTSPRPSCAAKARSHIMFVEILPNVLPPIVVETTVRLGYAIFTVASLSFLGFGIQPPSADWGLAIAENYGLIGGGYWWTVLFDAAATASLVVGVNLVADGIAGGARRLTRRRVDACARGPRGRLPRARPRQRGAARRVVRGRAAARPTGWSAKAAAASPPRRWRRCARCRATARCARAASWWPGRTLAELDAAALAAAARAHVSMVYQDPGRALNPSTDDRAAGRRGVRAARPLPRGGAGRGRGDARAGADRGDRRG